MSLKPRQTSVKGVRVGKEAAAFKRVAEAYTKKATSSPKAANTALVRLGIYDAKGNLTKNYR
jgi:hypothetical protein